MAVASALATCLLQPLQAEAQADEAFVSILEPVEWSGEVTRGIADIALEAKGVTVTSDSP